MPLQIHTIVSMPFQENTYIVWPEAGGGGGALVVDPGMDPEAIHEFLSDWNLTPQAILNTHGHLDHIAGNGRMKQDFPTAPLIVGVNDAPLLADPDANFSSAIGAPIISPRADRLVAEGDVIEAAGLRLEVLDVPGHSPGHVVFVYRGEPAIVFGGDVLFREGVGRFDFPGSNGQLLYRGIREKLFTLPDATVVYPGHGPTTTIGHEKRFNPFVGLRQDR
jgi:hydroxyacylglutathione hydrolase